MLIRFEADENGLVVAFQSIGYKEVVEVKFKNNCLKADLT